MLIGWAGELWSKWTEPAYLCVYSEHRLLVSWRHTVRDLGILKSVGVSGCDINKGGPQGGILVHRHGIVQRIEERSVVIDVSNNDIHYSLWTKIETKSKT